MKSTKALKFFAALLAVLFILSGCGAESGNSSEAKFGTTGYNYKDASSEVGSAMTEENLSDRKIIYTSYVNMESTGYDESYEKIKAFITSSNGYISESSYTGRGINSANTERYCSITARIPAESYTTFLEQLNDAGKITTLTEHTADVTASYQDYEARISALEVQEERLLGMLSETKDVNSLILIEERLSNVRYEIENYQASLNYLKNAVAYSTVVIYLDEVITSSSNIGQQILGALQTGWNGLVNGFAEFFIWFFSALPTIILLAAAAIIIVKIVKKQLKKKLPIPTAETPTKEKEPEQNQ